MSQRLIRSIFALFALVLLPASLVLAQSPASDSWRAAQTAGPHKGKLLVVTLEHPDRRQTCHIQSFTVDKLVCRRAFGGTRTYLPGEVLALVLPGDRASEIALVLGFNGGLGAAIWGTVVLAAACPACAAATALAAYFCFAAAGAVLIGDDQPERLLYLAPNHHLAGKLSSLEV